jgi:hypothetical protein
MDEAPFGPLTESEARALGNKLADLATQLTPKERWFLQEVFNRGIQVGPPGSEVRGQDLPTSTENVLFPTGMAGIYGVEEPSSYSDAATEYKLQFGF